MTAILGINHHLKPSCPRAKPYTRSTTENKSIPNE